jgi:hypothetical protein
MPHKGTMQNPCLYAGEREGEMEMEMEIDKARMVLMYVMGEARLTRVSCGCRRHIMHGLLTRNLLLLYRSAPIPLRAVTA